VVAMEVKTGYLYFLKDEFYKKVNDPNIMSNKTASSRPTYLTIKDKDILWFIPLSTKVEKYKPIIEKKINRYGSCRTIMIRKIAEKDSTVLLQNAFPILEKYIDHAHMVDGKPLKVIESLKQEILSNFYYMLSQKKKGINLFFADIDRLKKMMLEELK